MAGGIMRREFFAGAAALALTGMAKPFMLRTADGRNSKGSVWRAAGRRRGTILFSHGALSSPAKYEALLTPWAAAGWDIYAPLHVDSTDHPDTAKYKGLASWPARLEDMRALSRHVGGRFVAAGHSYGGLVALVLGGATPTNAGGVTGPLADPHVRCAVAFSPPGPGLGPIDAAGYATLKVPAFIETGTRDTFPGMPADEGKAHLTAYTAAAPGGDRYALLLEGVDHYFGGVICRPELPGPKQSERFGDAVALSTLFLDGFGAGDAKARTALDARLSETGPVRLARK